jgi:hypothetical protein
MIVKAALSCFVLASLFNGTTWWALMLADGSGVAELIQLGGTGGLIVSLLGGVTALWRDRSELRTQYQQEIKELREVLVRERTEHRAEVAAIQEQHKRDLSDITERYLEELQRQIDRVRVDTQRDTKRQLDERADQQQVN